MMIDPNKFAALLRLLTMSAYAVLVGIVAGGAAVIFRLLIALFHNLFFFRMWSFDYNANLLTPESIWGAGVIFLPVLGALIVALIAERYAPEIRGSGVPNILKAIYFGEGKIHWRVAGLKSAASAIAIGSGASIGREGPIVQIASALGALLGFRQGPAERAVLIAAGAAGGIAATFNAPLGGLFFALELLLPAITSRTLLTVMISVTVANSVAVRLLGPPRLLGPFPGESYETLIASGGAWLVFLALGVAGGLYGIMFESGVGWVKRQAPGISRRYWVRYAFGMLLVGGILYGMFRIAGGYFVEGVNFAAVAALLAGAEYSAGFLLLLLAAKYLVSVISLGAGASGGVFSPLIFAGGILGALFGAGLQAVLPEMNIPPALCILGGMAGVVGGVTGGVLTGTLTVIEMTGAGTGTAPLLLLCALASAAVRKLVLPQSIYNRELRRMGQSPHDGLAADRFSNTPIGDIASRNFREADGPAPAPDAVPSAADKIKLIRRTAEGHWDWLSRSNRTPEQVRSTRMLALPPGVEVARALRLLHELHLEYIVVVDRHNHAVGVVFDAEIRRYGAECARLLES